MGFIKRQLLKVIKWDDSTLDTIVYRYPMTDRDEIMNGCQLIVSESQVAMLVSGGQIADVYAPGTHKLTTGNMPILTKLASWKYGFDSPFKADVYYVNTKQFTNMKWGTASKIAMRDKDFGTVRVGARGTYAFKVEDAALFMREIFGTNKDYSTSALVEYFKSMVVSNFAKVIGECGIPVLDLQAKYIELGEKLQNELTDDFGKIGLNIVAVYIESIVLPETVEEALDKRATVGVMGDKLDEFTRLQSAEAIRDAAKNPGGGIAGAGVGLAAGVTMGQMMANAMGTNQNQNNATQSPSQPTSAGKHCTNCGALLPAGAKFCANCGQKVDTKPVCPSCHTEVPAGAKFCPNCGKAL